jgi:hypothetical protein
VNVLRIDANERTGMTLAEFKYALRKIEELGVKDEDIVRVDVVFSLDSNGAPVRRVYVPVEK